MKLIAKIAKLLLFGCVTLAGLAYILSALEERRQQSIKTRQAALDRTQMVRLDPHPTLNVSESIYWGAKLPITNLSVVETVRLVKVRFKLYDCKNVDLEPGCKAIGDETATAYVTIPPGQHRETMAPVAFPDLPALDMPNWSWRYEVVAVGTASDTR